MLADPSALLTLTIGAGIYIKESIVLEDVEIKHNACVIYLIIGWNCRARAWIRFEGTPTLGRSHTESITILSMDCGVKDEVRVQSCVAFQGLCAHPSDSGLSSKLDNDFELARGLYGRPKVCC